MLEFVSYKSGSSGNMYSVKNETTHLLIEAGLRDKETKNHLGMQLAEVDGCLVSHGHQDHCKNAHGLVKLGIDVYASSTTLEIINGISHRFHVIEALKEFYIKDFKIIPFELEHDIGGILGFSIECLLSHEKLVYITDSYYCRYKFSKVTIFCVECNYTDDDLVNNLDEGIIDGSRYGRVRWSHFGLSYVKQFLDSNDLSVCRGIYLLHISDTNADKKRIKKEIQELTGKPVYLC